ncbi:MAG: 30S ribosomal protein S6 [bacterium]|nr:30S ribosomal protein S6 [bacterium]
MRTYEAMFLFDPAYANDFSKVEHEVGRLLERVGAEPIMTRKWEERRLAYEIRGRKRGCYVLCFFKGSPDKITELERDARLSEPILRLLVLKADHMTAEDMEKAYPSRGEPAEAPPREARAAAAAAPAAKTEAAPAPSEDKPVADAKAAPAEKAPEPDAPVEPVATSEPAQPEGESVDAPAEPVPAVDRPEAATE